MRGVGRTQADAHARGPCVTFNIAQGHFSHSKNDVGSFVAKTRRGRKVMDQFRRLASSSERAPVADNTAKGDAGTESLNDKEEKILRVITEGMSNRQIAATMCLAEGTVKNYVSRIMEKLHANTRTALAVISARQRRTDSV
jgi:DNA-binding NarL/FixJ family response regulator